MSHATTMAEHVDRIVASYEARPTSLVMILQEVQRDFAHLPRAALEQISRRLDLALSQIYGVATFYQAFSLEPRVGQIVSVCTGTACYVRNSESIVQALERGLGVKRGQTTPDTKLRLETVNCVGCCALGPVVVSGEKRWGHLRVPQVKRLIEVLRTDAAHPNGAAQAR